MIHPHTELRFISPEIGYGVFATALIPCGTIVYVKDALEIEVDPDQFATLDPLLQQQVDRFSYMDERGIRIVSWDLAKYVNHRCDCNTMSTGYGFEIALRDIQSGEEITDEYGLFNISEPMRLDCGCPNCRGKLTPEDIDRYYPQWDEAVREALDHLGSVAQPLWSLLSADMAKDVYGYLHHFCEYRSVLSLKQAGPSRIIELARPTCEVRGLEVLQSH